MELENSAHIIDELNNRVKMHMDESNRLKTALIDHTTLNDKLN